jgi:uncharacterized protein (TIGR00730 family)
MTKLIKAVCVFCGSGTGSRPAYETAARDLGLLLAREQVTLVYGGACVGLMGVLANTVLGAGGAVVGVMPGSLVAKEVAHRGLTKLHVVESMHERKALMASLADSFVALPGGYGTLDELCEIITWSQLGIHEKPVGLLNIAGFFDGLLCLLDHAAAEGFIRPSHRSLLIEESDPESLWKRLQEHDPPPRVEKWLDRSQT